MYEFKEGDKVKCLKNDLTCDYYIKNKIYTVKSYNKEGDYVRTINGAGLSNGWAAKNFELVTEENIEKQLTSWGF